MTSLQKNYNINVKISINKIVDSLVFVTALLLLLHIISSVISTKIGCETIPWGKHFCRLFNMDAESNIPTWLQSIILFASSFFAFWAGLSYPKCERKLKKMWFSISVILLLFSIDEISMLHNRIRLPHDEGLSCGIFTIPHHFFWIVPGIFAVIIVGSIMYKLLLMIDKVTQRRLLIAGIVYVAGALGCEIISALTWETIGRTKEFSYYLLVGAEETIEFAGGIMCLRAILMFISKRKSGLYILN